MKRGLLLAGAALQGIGAGVASHAETVRQRALRQMEIDAQNARDENNRAFQAQENQNNREFQATQTDKQIGAQEFNTMQTIAAQTTRQRESDASAEERTRMQEAGANSRAASADSRARGLITRVDTDADGNAVGITAGGEKKDLGYKVLAKEMTAEQKLAVDTAVKAATEVDQESGKATVNADRLAGMLKGSKDPKVRNIGEMLNSQNADALLADLTAGQAEARATNEASIEAGEPTPAENRGMGPSAKDPPKMEDNKLGARGNPHKPMSEADFAKIPQGEFYVDPDDNKVYRKN